MSTVEDFELAAEIEATVRALPGVTGVFQAGLTVARVVEVGARLLGLREGAATLVLLEREAETIRVSVAIGVDSAFGATETARHTHDAVAAALRDRGESVASIQVTVVHIEQAVPARISLPETAVPGAAIADPV